MKGVWELSELIKQRNCIDHKISNIIEWPAEKGHIAEWIASQIFSITLNESKNKKGYDGIFNSPDLNGKKVDVKYSPFNEHLINLNPNVGEDIYLMVLTGPYKSASKAKHTYRPFCISNIYLFNEIDLCRTLTKKEVAVGTASSVKKELWDKAEIYPEDRLHCDLGMNLEIVKLFECEECNIDQDKELKVNE